MSGIQLRNAIDAGCCRRVIRYDIRRTAKSRITSVMIGILMRNVATMFLSSTGSDAEASR